ncbi:MAG: Aspartate aminotransferase [Methanoregulaceae archaeon PtaB.Bin009]|nr:MAG: Aspartate aminotransferase [Methanoregulaceae archaeon PtaB.Bin009]
MNTHWRIPMAHLQREYGSLGNRLQLAIFQVLESGTFIQGSQLGLFEQEFSEYIGVNHCIGVNSGSDALYLSLCALGVGPGDEVITVPNSFIASADAIVRCGARPVFVDVEKDSYCMDFEWIEKHITSRTKVILPVHLHGKTAKMEEIVEIAENHSLWIVEDACQSHGADINGRRTGSIGTLGCFSFYPTKNIGCYGDGGAITTNSADLCQRCRIYRDYGRVDRYSHAVTGINSRLDEIQAAVLRIKLEYLDKWNERRRTIAMRYIEGLERTDLVLPAEGSQKGHVFHNFVIRHKKRDEIKEKLSGKGIESAIHYPIPIHLQSSYQSYRNTRLPVSERICNEILSLPVNPWLTDDETDIVIDQVKQCLS